MMDKRTKAYRQLVAQKKARSKKVKTVAGILILLFLASCILIQSLRKPQGPVLPTEESLKGQIMENPVKPVEAQETPFCFDPITCIRDVGEQLGASNQDILMMIRIARCESGLRPEATNVNKNGTIDRGVFQINSIHKELLNKDAFDFEKNIRFAWKMQREQGFTPWVCFLKVKNQK